MIQTYLLYTQGMSKSYRRRDNPVVGLKQTIDVPERGVPIKEQLDDNRYSKKNL